MATHAVAHNLSGPIQSDAGEGVGAVALGGDTTIDDMQRAVRALAGQAAAVKAATGAVTTHSSFLWSEPNGPAQRSDTNVGRNDAADQLLMIAADARSSFAFVTGAAQSFEACIAAAALAITELAVAIHAAAGSSTQSAYLPAVADGLVAQADTAIARLMQNTRQIDEIVDYIARIALRSNTLALDVVIEAACEADISGRFATASGQAHPLAALAAQLTAEVHALAATIVQGADEARIVMERAIALITDLRAAMHPVSVAQNCEMIGPHDPPRRRVGG